MPHNEGNPVQSGSVEEMRPLMVDGVFGGVDPAAGRLAFYIDINVIAVSDTGAMEANSVNRFFIPEIRMSPETFCSIADMMKTQADQYRQSMREYYANPERPTIEKTSSENGRSS